jgi:hypothetical protein
MNLTESKLYLAGRIRTRTPLGAAEYLDVALTDRESYDKRCRVALNAMEIYRASFPEEWANSTSPYLSTQREQELYRLVDANLFPLLLSETVDIETHIRREPQFFLPFIPMRGIQRHTWIGGQFHFWEIESAFRIAQVLARMTGAGGEGWSALCLNHGIAREPAPAKPLAAVGWSLFSYSCHVEDSPLRYFPIAFHMINYKTGNPWLDLPQVGFFGFQWSLEKIMELHLAMVDANRFGDAIVELSKWFDEDPPARIRRAVELWNDAASKEGAAGAEGLYIDEATREWHAEDRLQIQDTEMVRA